MIGLLEYDYPEGLKDSIVDIFHMVLEGTPVFPPHALSQFKLQLLLVVLAEVFSHDWIPVRVQTVRLGSNPKVFHTSILFNTKGPIITVKILIHVLASYKRCTVFI